MTVFVFIASLLAAMALGIPIAYALLASGVALMWHLHLFDPADPGARTSSTAPTASPCWRCPSSCSPARS